MEEEDKVECNEEFEITNTNMSEIEDALNSIFALIDEENQKLGNTKRIASKIENIITLSLPILELFKPQSRFLVENSKGIKSELSNLKKEISNLGKKIDKNCNVSQNVARKGSEKSRKSSKSNEKIKEKIVIDENESKKETIELNKKKIKMVNKSIQCNQHSYLLNNPEFSTSKIQNSTSNKLEKSITSNKRGKSSKSNFNISESLVDIIPVTEPISGYFSLKNETETIAYTDGMNKAILNTTFSAMAFGNNKTFMVIYLGVGYAICNEGIPYVEIPDRSKFTINFN